MRERSVNQTWRNSLRLNIKRLSYQVKVKYWNQNMIFIMDFNFMIVGIQVKSGILRAFYR